MQAQRTNAASDPGWVTDTGPPAAVVGTPMLSVRRTPVWLSDPVTRDRLADKVSAIVASSSIPPQTCLVVYRDEEPITSQQSSALLAPSSLMKIVTATAILEKAGPAATYTTEVFVRADALEAAVDGTLRGDVYLVGRGDPGLSTPAYIERFAEPRAYTDFTDLIAQVAAALRRHGIVTIEGGVVADESRFPEEERDYSAELVEPGGSAIWKQSYVIENQVGPLSALLLNDGYVSFPSSASYASRRQNQRAPDPARHAATMLGEQLGTKGIVVTGSISKGVAPALADRSSLGAVESPSMAEIVARMLRFSDNTTAEMLLKEIGRRSAGSARDQAVLGVYDVLQRELGLSTEGVVIFDGSGLSVHNRLTCELVARLLRDAGPGSPLVEGLAVVGENGTLRDCDVDPPPEGDSEAAVAEVNDNRLWAKSGTLNDVTALAGVTVADNDDVLTFAMISNREGLIFELGFCNDIQKSLIAAAAGHPYGPSSADAVLHPLPAVAAPAEAPAGADDGG